MRFGGFDGQTLFALPCPFTITYLGYQQPTPYLVLIFYL
jgi:hypothetical protein